MIKRKYKPDKTFTMKNDGFFGELYISTDNIFNGKCIIAFGGSEGNFLLTQLCADKFKDAGISVMIIAYHGKNGLPKILKNQPVDVIENSAKYFSLNEKEKDIIITHMFPTLPHKVPKYLESWLVSLVDKAVATYEFYCSYGKPYVYRFSNIYIFLFLFLR